VLVGAVMGAVGGLATRLRLGADGRPLGRAGWLAASMGSEEDSRRILR
jgi:hypothetical protein